MPESLAFTIGDEEWYVGDELRKFVVTHIEGLLDGERYVVHMNGSSYWIYFTENMRLTLDKRAKEVI